MTVVAEAVNGAQAVSAYRQKTPNIRLINLRMPEMSRVEAMAAIHDAFPDRRLIALTTYEGEANVRRAFTAGAVPNELMDRSIYDGDLLDLQPATSAPPRINKTPSLRGTFAHNPVSSL